jgi:magnesium-transporting ATPase (P-type)
MTSHGSGFRGVISFLDNLGVYDVVLPFLLVFTIVFAILEKTRILGEDDIGGQKHTKKNLNSIMAFVIAFLVIASTSLVRIINEFLANIVLLIILIISFLMLIGTFWGTGEVKLDKDSGWMKFFMVAIFIAIVAILLEAIGWLQDIMDIIWRTPNTDWAATLVLLVIVLAFMYFVTQDRMDSHKHNNKKE